MESSRWVVMGVSGCGKSTVGQALAGALAVSYVEGDQFHPPANVAKMSAGIALDDADRHDWLQTLAGQVHGARLQNIGLVLGCSALKRKYRDQLRLADPALRFAHLNGARELIAGRLQARVGHYMFARDVALPKPREYVSPDGSLVMPAYRVFQQGPANHLGHRFSDTLDTHGLVAAGANGRVVFTNGSENRTYSGVIGQGGGIGDLKQVANRGGESVAVDKAGNVYVANGQVFVYAPDGKEIGRIDVPERPLQLIFGGDGDGTLFILTHHTLYAAGGFNGH